MRIALISINMYSKKLNFACPIHTYAFQQFLLRNGVETTILNYKPVYYNDFDLRHPADYYRQRYDAIADSGHQGRRTQEKLDELQQKIDLYSAKYEEREIRYDKFQHFIDTRYVKTDVCYDSDTLEVQDPDFDCYICVTDVIWKYDPADGFDRGFFLASKFMENKWKIAYAASRGVPPTYTPEQEAEFLYYVNDIDFLSAREESLQQYIESRTDRHVEMVLDPVLLNDRSLYDEIAVTPAEDRYIVLYYVMGRATDTIRMAVDYARAHGLKIVELTDFPDSHRLDEYDDVDKVFRYDVGIEEWLGYIKNAECVFTNSFHGTCFSILFEKKFYAGRRHGDKVTNLLQTLGLSSRRVSSFAEIEQLGEEPIDYDAVNRKLESQRASSSAFILNAIRECQRRERSRRDYSWWKRTQTYRMTYCGGSADHVSAAGYASEAGKTSVSDGMVCFTPNGRFTNTGFFCLGSSLFSARGKRFGGWKLKVRIDKQWFWYGRDGSLIADDGFVADGARLFAAGDMIPFIEVNHIAAMMAVAQWQDGEELSFRMLYNSGVKADEADIRVDDASIGVSRLPSGSYEHPAETVVVNDESGRFGTCHFALPSNYRFAGWRLRVRFGDTWYWYMADGTLSPRDAMSAGEKKRIRCFAEHDPIPYIPLCEIDVAVAEAVWRKLDYRLLYNSGRSRLACTCTYPRQVGTVRTLPSGSVELTPGTAATNDGAGVFLRNGFAYDGYAFAGWKLRYKTQGVWYWYSTGDGDAQAAADARKHASVFQPGDPLPVLECNRIDVAVAEAVWTVNSPAAAVQDKGLAARTKGRVLHILKRHE